MEPDSSYLLPSAPSYLQVSTSCSLLYRSTDAGVGAAAAEGSAEGLQHPCLCFREGLRTTNAQRQLWRVRRQAGERQGTGVSAASR